MDILAFTRKPTSSFELSACEALEQVLAHLDTSEFLTSGSPPRSAKATSERVESSEGEILRFHHADGYSRGEHRELSVDAKRQAGTVGKRNPVWFALCVELGTNSGLCFVKRNDTDLNVFAHLAALSMGPPRSSVFPVNGRHHGAIQCLHDHTGS